MPNEDETRVTILDYIDRIEVPGQVFARAAKGSGLFVVQRDLTPLQPPLQPPRKRLKMKAMQFLIATSPA